MARRAAGPTRQSVFPRKGERIPTAPTGPRNDGLAGASPPQSRLTARQRPYPLCPFGTFPPDRGNRPPDRGSRPPPYMVCTIRRGRCPHRPAGGHMGPPLRNLTNGADNWKRLIRHGLRPCHLPLKGKAWRAGSRPRPASSRPKSRRFAAVGLETRLRAQSWPFGPIHLLAPYAGGTLSCSPPHPALRATFPPVGGEAEGRPSIPKFKKFVHRDLEGVGQMKNDIQRRR